MDTIYNKITVNGKTLIDISSDTVDAEHLIQGYTAHDASGVQITGTATEGGSSAALIVDTTDSHGGIIREITTDTEVKLEGAKTVTPTSSRQTITPSQGYNGFSSVIVNAMSLGTAGTPTATKGSVSNYSVSVTPSVTNTTGYITGGTKNGTAVTVSASELVSGTKTITENGTGIDVANYASVDVNVANISGLEVYSSENGLPYTSTMIIDADSKEIPNVLNAYGAMENLVDLTIKGIIKRNTAGSIAQNEIFGASSYPNLKRLTIAPSGTIANYGSTDIATEFAFGHYAFNGTNLRELTLGSLNGAYYRGAGYFRGDCPVPPGASTTDIGSLDGIRVTIYTDQYRANMGSFSSAASTTIILQYDYQTGEVLTER